MLSIIKNYQLFSLKKSIIKILLLSLLNRNFVIDFLRKCFRLFSLKKNSFSISLKENCSITTFLKKITLVKKFVIDHLGIVIHYKNSAIFFKEKFVTDSFL